MGLGFKAAEELYEDMLNKVTKSREEWVSFLKSSTWMFEYNFGEQLLIYAQRPEARACATMEEWNKKALRWVKRKSKAITLLKYENGRNRIEYIFDISDTYQKSGANVGLWKLDKNKQWRELTYTLVSKYGDFKKKNSLEEALVSAIDNFIEDSLVEYYEEFKNIMDKGTLTGVEDEELKFIYTQTVRQNLIYKVFTRCDLDPFTVLPNYNFEYITYFDSIDTINNIGVTTRDLSRDMIREIRAFVKNKKERGALNEHSVQSSERLPDTEYRNSKQGNSNDGQIRKDEGEILERKQTMYIRANEDDGNTDTTLELDTENLRGEFKSNDRTNEKTGEYNRGNEVEESNAMGGNDEQFETYSRVNNNERNDIQLESLLLSEEEQKEIITGVENTSVFSFIQETIKEESEEKLEIPQIKKQQKSTIAQYELHSEIPLSERNNYRITDNELGVGTPKEKYARNIEAIKVLKKCQEEKRYATKEEQEILANYVGWGGLPDVFDKDKSNWNKEYEELKSLLTEKEYNEARQSTLTAFYTPPVVIKAIYKALENMGLEQGNILEPSCGIGNFMGLLPDSLNKCKLYGVEIDSISGEIARQLYQKNIIAVKGFEEVDMPDSFFDVAVGNVPFGDYKLADKRYDKNNFLIHDYFYAKTLDKVRPDGVIAFITSKGTMDKKNNSFRKYIAQRAELLGAIRLANDVFTDNAGTKTTTDIIFLQKKDKITDIEPSWLNLGMDENGIEMNQYFIENPNMILGKMEMVSSQYGMKSDCIPFQDANLEELLNGTIKNINANVKNYEIDEISVEENNTIPAIPTVRNYSYAVVDDKIYYRENSVMYLQEVPLTTDKDYER